MLNAIGLSTKKDRYWTSQSFLSDSDIDLFSVIVEATIELIKVNLEFGKTVVFPEQGLGTGKAMLKEKAPQCWEYLCRRLREEFGYNNGQSNQ